MSDIPHSTSSEPTNIRLVYGLLETGRLLGVSRRTIGRMIADKQLRTISIRGRTMVTADEIKRFLAACEAA